MTDPETAGSRATGPADPPVAPQTLEALVRPPVPAAPRPSPSHAEPQTGAPRDLAGEADDSTEQDDLAGSPHDEPQPDPPVGVEDPRGPIEAAAGTEIAVEPEVLLVPELTDVTYPTVDGGYAPPPRRPSAMTDRSSAVLPVYWPTGVVRELVDGLRPAARTIDAQLVREPVQVVWPEVPETGECRTPTLGAELMVSVGEQRGTPRTLDQALPNQAAPGERQADALDRLELVRLLAILLDELHRRDLVTRGATWGMFAFSLDPRPAVALTDAGSVRRVGGEFLVDPAESGGGGPFEADRQGFGSLARALLHAPEADPALWDDFVPPGLDPGQARSLRMLWERHDGPAGSRPQVAEWRLALGIAEPRAGRRGSA